jgi:hypothetical protein
MIASPESGRSPDRLRRRISDARQDHQALARRAATGADVADGGEQELNNIARLLCTCRVPRL